MEFPPLPSHEEKPKARFTGIFIPVEILEIEEISMLEQMLLAWIDALYSKERGGCFAKNDHFAQRLRVKENTIAKAITHLRQLGLIQDVSFDGRNRVIRSLVGKYVEHSQSKAGLDLNPMPDWIKIQSRVGFKSNPKESIPKEKSKAHTYHERKEERKEKQQQPVAVFSKPAKKEQASPSARISPLLADVPIPQMDKDYLSEKYDDGIISNALAWSKHPDTKPIKELAAALKWACENKIQPPKDKEKTVNNNFDASGFNRAYWREIYRILRSYEVNIDFRESPEYLEFSHGRIYFKDVSFLEQVSNLFRKRNVDLRIFDYIKICQNNLNDNRR